MNKDFHYYGTYVAARLAGYGKDDAEIIAYAAQYVDDSDEKMLTDPFGAYYIQDFTPVPTVQGIFDLLDKNFHWSEGALGSVADVWVPFHFLPGNYGETQNIKEYTGPKSDKGTVFTWAFDDESQQHFKLLCQPNSPLVKRLINDAIQHHQGKDYTLEMAGVRMHTLADTWAHMFYVGIPAWFANNAGVTVYRVTEEGKTPVKWQRVWPWDDSTDIIDGESATPDMLAYNSLVYLGHGRMGHLPDYPYYKYEYHPEWSSDKIVKDNSVLFLKGFRQMVKALECIRSNTPFNVDTYADLPAETQQAITDILGAEANDQCKAWTDNIGRILVGGTPLEPPVPYKKDGEHSWLEDLINCIQRQMPIDQTHYYHFNYAATLQVNLVRDELSENNVHIDSTPRECIVSTNFKSRQGMSIGHFYKQLQYYPKMNDEGLTLEIIKPTPKLLTSGDVVEIRTREDGVGEYDYLGAWETKALYYYSRSYDISKQKWGVEKVDTSVDKLIRAGDEVRFANIHFADSKPYMCTYEYFLGGTYLSTQTDGAADNTVWIMDHLVQFDMFIVTADYFVSDIIDRSLSTSIWDDMRTNAMVDPDGNVDIRNLKTALDTIGLAFIQATLSDAQKRQVWIQLRKLVTYQT